MVCPFRGFRWFASLFKPGAWSPRQLGFAVSMTCAARLSVPESLLFFRSFGRSRTPRQSHWLGISVSRSAREFDGVRPAISSFPKTSVPTRRRRKRKEKIDTGGVTALSSAAQSRINPRPTKKKSPLFLRPYSISPREVPAWRPLSPFVIPGPSKWAFLVRGMEPRGARRLEMMWLAPCTARCPRIRFLEPPRPSQADGAITAGASHENEAKISRN